MLFGQPALVKAAFAENKILNALKTRAFTLSSGRQLPASYLHQKQKIRRCDFFDALLTMR
jgi:hypothetical protein